VLSAARIIREVSVCNTDTSQLTKPKQFWSVSFLSTADHIVTHFGPQAVEIVPMKLTDLSVQVFAWSSVVLPTDLYIIVCEGFRK